MEYKPEFPSKAQRIERMKRLESPWDSKSPYGGDRDGQIKDLSAAPLGLCKDCGRPVDHPDRFVRCKTCRGAAPQSSGLSRGGQPHRADSETHRVSDLAQRTERQRQLYAPPPNLAQLMAPKPAAPPPVADSARPKISAPVPSGNFKRVSKEVDEARRKRREQLVRCESCVYATFAGAGVWFCPLPYCQTERRIERKEEPENVGDGTAGEPTAS